MLATDVYILVNNFVTSKTQQKKQFLPSFTAKLLVKRCRASAIQTQLVEEKKMRLNKKKIGTCTTYHCSF